jgi:hypothetical protein
MLEDSRSLDRVLYPKSDYCTFPNINIAGFVGFRFLFAFLRGDHSTAQIFVFFAGSGLFRPIYVL